MIRRSTTACSSAPFDHPDFGPVTPRMHGWTPLRQLFMDCPYHGLIVLRRMAADQTNVHKREKAAHFAYQNRDDDLFEEFRPMWEQYGYGVEK